MSINCVVIGSSGAIGQEFVKQFARRDNYVVHAFSQQQQLNVDANNIRHYLIDYLDESSMQQAAKIAATIGSIDILVIATGILHEPHIFPEKSLKELSADKFQRLFQVNTITPSLLMKHFIPKLNKSSRSICAVLSARVGSISDNQLGGWYAYRASKAALNMIIKNVAIETSRTNQYAIVAGLHPGTVDSDLSRPFQANIAQDKIFTPEFSVTKLIQIIDKFELSHTGRVFAWDFQEILP